MTLNGAHAELRSFLLHAKVTEVPPDWVRAHPSASYLLCPAEPDVCIPVRDGHALTVLVRWMAWTYSEDARPGSLVASRHRQAFAA